MTPPQECGALDLLALPCAGASATMYLRWRRWLPPHIGLVPIELPGRGGRFAEPFEHDHAALVARLCREHEARWRRPYALLGHSMGGLLAYGLVHRLAALGMPMPHLLIVSGCPSPWRRAHRRFPARGDRDALMADLKRQGGTPEAVFESPELLGMTLDTLDADYRVCESFVPATSPLPVPLRVWAGRQDDIPEDSIEAWRGEAPHGCAIDWYAGGHFFIREQERDVVDDLGRLLTAAVAQGCLAL